jgi:hypothetical protein
MTAMQASALRRWKQRLLGSAVLAAAACGATLERAGAQSAHPDFTGMWSGVFTTQDNEFWRVEDFTCFPGCTPTSYQYLVGLLDDPANDERPLSELTADTTQFMRKELADKATPEGLALQNAGTEANDPTILCQPYALVREAVNPLPLRIRADGENLVIDYEEWNQTRAIYMDGREHPADLQPTPLGHSIGRYEGDTLLVESKGLSPDIYYSFQSGGGYSDQAIVVERYRIENDPRRLILEMTVTDPVTLRAPHVLTKTWLWTPDVELVQDSCEDIPGVPSAR